MKDRLLAFGTDQFIDVFTFENISVIPEENCKTFLKWHNRH